MKKKSFLKRLSKNILNKKITPLESRKFFLGLRVLIPVILIYKIFLYNYYLIRENKVFNIPNIGLLVFIMFILVLECILLILIERYTIRNWQPKGENSWLKETLFIYIAATYLFDIIQIYFLFKILPHEFNLFLHITYALAFCQSFIFPSYIFWKGDKNWYKGYKIIRHGLTGGAFASIVLIPIIYIQGRPFVTIISYFHFLGEVFVLVFIATYLRIRTAEKQLTLKKIAEEERRITQIRNERVMVLADLPHLIKTNLESNLENELLNFGELASYIGKSLNVEYCAIGNISDGYLLDNEQWVLLHETTKPIEYLEKVKKCNIEGSFIGEALREPNQDRGVKFVAGKNSYLPINNEYVEIYEKYILPSKKLHSMLAVGLFRLDENSNREPIGYIHLINKLILNNQEDFGIYNEGFNDEDLTTALLIAKQIELILINIKKNLELKKEYIILEDLSEELKLRNTDEILVNELMEENNTDELFSQVLNYINKEFNCRASSFWYPIWNGYKPIEKPNENWHHPINLFETDLNGLKIVLRSLEINQQVVGCSNKEINDIKGTILSRQGYDVRKILVGKLLEEHFLYYEPTEPNDLIFISNIIGDQNDSCFGNINTHLDTDFYLTFPVYRVAYFKDPKSFIHRGNAEHVIGLFHLKYNRSEFDPTDSHLIKRLGNLSRNLSILFDKNLYEKRYLQIEKLKNVLYKLPINDSKIFYKELVNIVKDVIGCEICSLFIRSNNPKNLKLAATTAHKVLINGKKIELSSDNIDKEIYHGDIERSFTMNIYKSLNVCLNYDESIKNNFSDQIFLEETLDKESDRRFHHKSFLAAPLLNNKSIDKNSDAKIGVIRCINKIEKGALFNSFIQADAEFLLLLTGIISKFIDYVQWNEYKLYNAMSFAHDFRLPLNELRSGTMGLKNSLRNNRLIESNTYADRQYHLIDMLIAQISNFEDSFWETEFAFDKTLSEVHPSLIDINDDLKNIVELMDADWKKITGASIIVRNSFMVDKIFADKKLIHRVFLNLLKNAVRYSYQGPSPHNITIYYNRETESFEGSDIVKWDTFEFENYGIGIREDEAKSIFLKGVRGRDADKFSKAGTGLGLYTVSEIMKGHYGKVVVKSYNNPTIIKIYLPIYDQSPLNKKKQ